MQEAHDPAEDKTLEMHVGAVLRGEANHAEPGTASVVELKRAHAD